MTASCSSQIYFNFDPNLTTIVLRAMSLRGSRIHQNVLRSLPTVLSSTTTSTRACFATCSKIQQEVGKPSKTTPEIDTSRSHERTDHNESSNKSPPRRRRLPAFAPFLLALPLGWYLSTRLASSSPNHRTYADPTDFILYTLIAKDPVSPSSSIFRLRPSTNKLLDLDEPSFARAVTSVQFKQPQLQIARAYTLLPHADGQHLDELRFLIRRERGGEVSGFLHDLPVGAKIELRGPKTEFVVPGKVNKVLFIAGGTGIAPALQVVDLLEEEEEADVHVLWGNRKREDCEGGVGDTTTAAGRKKGWGLWRLWGGEEKGGGRRREDDGSKKGEIVRRLDGFREEGSSTSAEVQRSERVRVDYYVDEEGTFIRPRDIKKALELLSSSSSSQRSDRSDGADDKKLIFISGPDGFISHWAGPKKWIDGRETQGPLGGILAYLDLKGWQVVKL